MKKSRLIVFGICVITILTMIVTLAPSIRNGMTLGLDLQGGFEILYEVSPLDGQDRMDVPQEATSEAGRGRIVFVGTDGEQQIITKNLNYSVDDHDDAGGDAPNPRQPVPDPGGTDRPGAAGGGTGGGRAQLHGVEPIHHPKHPAGSRRGNGDAERREQPRWRNKLQQPDGRLV